MISTTFALKMAQATALTVLHLLTVLYMAVLYVPTVLHANVLSRGCRLPLTLTLARGTTLQRFNAEQIKFF